MGGELLTHRKRHHPGQGRDQDAGKLGQADERKASAGGLSFVKALRPCLLGINPSIFQRKIRFKSTCPEGAVPKDGPSAGMAMGHLDRLDPDGIAVRKPET